MPRKPKIKPDPNAMRRGPDEVAHSAECGGGLCREAELVAKGEVEKPRGLDVQPKTGKGS